MHAKRIIIAALLAAGLAVSAVAAGFAKTAEYVENQFTDVPATEWYAAEVRSTYELGLMKGEGEGVFNPDGNVTVAEAVTMASRAAAIYAGETIDMGVAGEWYAPYVAYATAKGFVADGQFADYDRPARRYEVAVLFENAMPDGYFTAKNDVAKIPDVSDKRSYKDDLLTLYRAGVVMGSDSYGNFFPENNITRAEAAAIINRVALPENRLVKTLDKTSEDDAYLLINTPEMQAPREGINSGWLLDARGALPRTTIANVYGVLTDIDDNASSAFIREINPTVTGKIVVETSLSISGYNGVYASFCTADGTSLYRIETIDGDWQIRNADGTYQKIYEIDEMERGFILQIELDLDNRRSVTYINYKETGVYPLSGELGEGVTSLRFGTTEEAVATTLNLLSLRAYVNYAVYDDFKYDPTGAVVPFGYTGSGAVIKHAGKNTELLMESGSVSKTFVPVSGTAVAEILFILPEAQDMSFTLAGSGAPLAEFTAKDGCFYIGDTLLTENFESGMWHRLRLEADTDEQTVTVKLNGKVVGSVPFAATAYSADQITLTTFGDLPEMDDSEELKRREKNAPRFDNIKVFRLVEHEDYVPEPIVPKGEDRYTVGMNVCSLWQNGTSYGWSCITPYDDIQPVLGYYDEGNPETADWEIKYLVEHGIDFQAFCIFPDQSDAPLKMEETVHLHDAFMNAKYSDMSHFAIIWEAAAGAKPAGMEAWRKYYVPYFIENYFKDPRYITVDNRPILCVFSPGSIVKEDYLGSDAGLKEAFDYLESEVKKLGFDGMVYLACGSATDRMSDMGFDGCYAYNWGKEGCTFEHNRKSILASASNPAVYTVPTVSVGFNSIAWEGVRSPMIPMDEYRAAHEWVRDEYLPAHAQENWQKNLVMLSTWNEYGEGTYIMPTADEKGFGYIDVIRETYTDEKADAFVNTVPTDAQKTRINRLYPQYRRLLRKQGNYTPEIDESKLTAVMSLNLDPKQNGANFWLSDRATYSERDGLFDYARGNDPQLIQDVRLPEGMRLENIQAVRIIADIPADERFQIFFVTDETSGYSESRTINLRSDSSMLKEYLISTSNVAGWTGTLRKIRLDPVETDGMPYQILSVEFLTVPDKVSKEMFINDISFTMSFEPQLAENGDILIAFEPALAMDFRLGLFHLWDKVSGTLTLQNPSHTVVYRVGSDTYTVDGKEKPLGFTVTALDGLPLIPIQSLCKEMGYSFRLDQNVMKVETYQKAYLDNIPARVSGIYEFNYPGDNAGWSSSNTVLLAYDGYLRSETYLQNERDPVLWKTLENPLAADTHRKIEVRVRYRYDAEKPLTMQVFFLTDKNKGWSESKSLKIKLEHIDSEGEWETYVFDMSTVDTWQDNITQIRFDPFDASGYMEIDYFRITE